MLDTVLIEHTALECGSSCFRHSIAYKFSLFGTKKLLRPANSVFLDRRGDHALELVSPTGSALFGMVYLSHGTVPKIVDCAFSTTPDHSAQCHCSRGANDRITCDRQLTQRQRNLMTCCERRCGAE